LDDTEPVFYSDTKLKREPGLRFRRDILPFLGAGELQGGKELVLTWGINPKCPNETKAKQSRRWHGAVLPEHRYRNPGSADNYWEGALNAFRDCAPSPFHKRYLHLLKGILGSKWLETWRNHYATFDMVPWYADRWSVGRLTKKRVELIRPHLKACGELIQGASPRLAVFNGRNWDELLRVTPQVFGSPFRERGRIDYTTVTGKSHRGAVLVGEICLCDQPIPALVMTWFVHQTRPPLSDEELLWLGETLQVKFQL
jgi:hypothetical protein